MNIGIIDADLLDKGTRHPNLALMKISGYYKGLGNNVELLHDYKNIKEYDQVFLSCVFSFTKIPININDYDNLKCGGTGLYWDKAESLPYEIEHHMPDYHLYDEYIKKEIERGMKPVHFKDYMNYSIGFTTKGCVRKCKFCINHNKSKVEKHSLVKEFFDPSRKYIYLWDDNFLAYPNWKEVLEELKETNRRFQFRQGLDIRFMTDEKAIELSNVKYHEDFIFAFDDITDKEIIINKLTLWRKHCKKKTKLYVLCGFDKENRYDRDFWKRDIISTFERIKILMSFTCVPYIMRYEKYTESPFRGMYVTIARWCNQQSFFKKQSLREFVYITDAKTQKGNYSSKRYLEDFENTFPEIASEYFDLKYEQLKK